MNEVFETGIEFRTFKFSLQGGLTVSVPVCFSLSLTHTLACFLFDSAYFVSQGHNWGFTVIQDGTKYCTEVLATKIIL